MKKMLIGAVTIAACVALCAAVWPQTGAGEEVRREENAGATAAAAAELVELPEEPVVTTMVEQIEPSPEKKDIVAAPENADTPAAELPTAPVRPAQTAPSTAAHPYHTDIYPNNVYSEELIYDADGNLIGKTITYPTAFGSDTVWIDGHAYYDLPGFGLIEWSGPGSVTEDYTMYENGNKIGIMGGEDESPAQTTATAQPEEQPKPTGEVIDQAINTAPERSSTPPDYKPDATPPDDPNARSFP